MRYRERGHQAVPRRHREWAYQGDTCPAYHRLPPPSHREREGTPWTRAPSWGLSARSAQIRARSAQIRARPIRGAGGGPAEGGGVSAGGHGHASIYAFLQWSDEGYCGGYMCGMARSPRPPPSPGLTALHTGIRFSSSFPLHARNPDLAFTFYMHSSLYKKTRAPPFCFFAICFRICFRSLARCCGLCAQCPACALGAAAFRAL